MRGLGTGCVEFMDWKDESWFGHDMNLTVIFSIDIAVLC
jgi:hypothetical protein